MSDHLTPKLCECGCGLPAPIAKRNHSYWGQVKGQPQRFRKGHWSKTVQKMLPTSKMWDIQETGHSTPCWIWNRGLDKGGYARIANRLAYREVYTMYVGPIPEGLDMDHLCRNPSCVNPGHLEPVTHAENLRRGAGAKLSHEKVSEIRTLHAEGWSYDELAVRYAVGTRAIYNVVKGKTWA